MVTSTFSCLSSLVCDRPKAGAYKMVDHGWANQLAGKACIFFAKRFWKTHRKQRQHQKWKWAQRFLAVCRLQFFAFPLHSSPFSSLLFLALFWSFFERQSFYVADARFDLLGSVSSSPSSLDNRYKPPHPALVFSSENNWPSHLLDYWTYSHTFWKQMNGIASQRDIQL